MTNKLYTETHNKLSNRVTLPLLSSLPIETTTPIVKELLNRTAALTKIKQSPLLSNYNLKRSENDKNKCKRQSHDDNYYYYESKSLPSVKGHWLMHSLLSANRQIRQHATLAILHAVPIHSGTNDMNAFDKAGENENKKKDQDDRLDMNHDGKDNNDREDKGQQKEKSTQVEDRERHVDTIIDILWNIVQDEFYAFHSTASSNNNQNETYSHTPSEALIQTMGLLIHYLSHCRDENFYQFIIKGRGLDWISSSILRLVHLSMNIDSHVASSSFIPQHHQQKSECISASEKKQKEKFEKGKYDDQDEDTKTTGDKKNNPLPNLPSPSIHKPRHHFVATGLTQSKVVPNILQTNVETEEQIQRRLCLLVDFLVRLMLFVPASSTSSPNPSTASKPNCYKERNELVWNYFWRKSHNVSDSSGSGIVRNSSSSPPSYSTMERSTSASNVNHALESKSLSPLACLLATSFILQKSDVYNPLVPVLNSPSSSSSSPFGSSTSPPSTSLSLLGGGSNVSDILTVEDFILKPHARLERIHWMLNKLMDVNGSIAVMHDYKDNPSSELRHDRMNKNKKKKNDCDAEAGNESGGKGGSTSRTIFTTSGRKRRRNESGIATDVSTFALNRRRRHSGFRRKRPVLTRRSSFDASAVGRKRSGRTSAQVVF